MDEPWRNALVGRSLLPSSPPPSPGRQQEQQRQASGRIRRLVAPDPSFDRILPAPAMDAPAFPQARRGGGAAGGVQQHHRHEPMPMLPMNTMQPPPPPSHRRDPSSRIVTAAGENQKHAHHHRHHDDGQHRGPAGPLLTTASTKQGMAPSLSSRMRASSTDSTSGAFYHRSDLPAKNLSGLFVRSSSSSARPQPSTTAADPPAAPADGRRLAADLRALGGPVEQGGGRGRLLSRRRKNLPPSFRGAGASQQQPPPSGLVIEASDNTTTAARWRRGPREEHDDRRIAAAEMGQSALAEPATGRPSAAAVATSFGVPGRFAQAPLYGTALLRDPAPDGGLELTIGPPEIAPSASADPVLPPSYQWTHHAVAGPPHPLPTPRRRREIEMFSALARAGAAASPRITLPHGQTSPVHERDRGPEEWVPLRPPAEPLAFRPLPAESTDEDSSSRDGGAWSSGSELYRGRGISEETEGGRGEDEDDASSFKSAPGRRLGGGGPLPPAPGIAPADASASAAIGNFLTWLDPTPWLTRDVKWNTSDGVPYFDSRSKWTAAGMFRHLLWNPINPEFTSLQLFCWAVILGVVMGFYTAAWKALIERCIELVWVTVPATLLRWGIFTPLDGGFPLYHYMWICPTVMGGFLSYVVAALPVKIPDQNEWIRGVHTRGTQDHRTFPSLFLLSTAGMASGLSLGPELPLVLTAGMAGSWLGLTCKQSILQARVMNLTAASAAIGGFFGFPMAGALFVLELPHRMGLQYFEALSPATVSSIVAVLTNRMVVGNDVTGYYSYPFLTATLPSEVFTSAIVYGFWGAAMGVAYAEGCKKLKALVHDLFHDDAAKATSSFHRDYGDVSSTEIGEQKPLLMRKEQGTRGHGLKFSFRGVFQGWKPAEPARNALRGAVAGSVVGCLGMFLPHVMFWGEAQLQTLIDKGRTPLPVFGIGDEPTAALSALGRCMMDPSDELAIRNGFGLGCSFFISVAKIVTTGLSLGTGIVGGHFWGPLFVGCSSGHFLTQAVRMLSEKTGYGATLAQYPCVVILCVMGSAHVVTYRAHMAIMLILTLTISAFNPEDGRNGNVAGDYSAVFPLLVVSVFVSLMVTRSTVFYPTQRSRGDIMAVPEVLCEPGMVGRPMVLDYEVLDPEDDDPSEYGADDDDSTTKQKVLNALSPVDIEKNFEKAMGSSEKTPVEPGSSGSPAPLSSERLDELLSKPLEQWEATPKRKHSVYPPVHHRRIRSDPVQGNPRAPTVVVPQSPVGIDRGSSSSSLSQTGDVRLLKGVRYRSNSSSTASSPKTLVRVSAYGEVLELQPSLLDQARTRAASSAYDSHHKNQGRHSRNNSQSSTATATSLGSLQVPSLNG